MDQKLSPSAASEKLDETGALKALKDLFDFHALGLKAKAGEYGSQVKIEPCTHAVSKGRCGLALKRGETRCGFHSNMDRFAAAGYTASEIYEGAPAEKQIARRLGLS